VQKWLLQRFRLQIQYRLGIHEWVQTAAQGSWQFSRLSQRLYAAHQKRLLDREVQHAADTETQVRRHHSAAGEVQLLADVRKRLRTVKQVDPSAVWKQNLLKHVRVPPQDPVVHEQLPDAALQRVERMSGQAGNIDQHLRFGVRRLALYPERTRHDHPCRQIHDQQLCLQSRLGWVSLRVHQHHGRPVVGETQKLDSHGYRLLHEPSNERAAAHQDKLVLDEVWQGQTIVVRLLAGASWGPREPNCRPGQVDGLRHRLVPPHESESLLCAEDPETQDMQLFQVQKQVRILLP